MITTFLAIFAIVTLRYFLSSGLPYLVLNVWGAEKYQRRRIARESVGSNWVKHEVIWSLSSCIIFSVFGAGLIHFWNAGMTQIYLQWNKYGWWYLPLSFAIYAVLHETYFYWTHRWLHWPRIFKRFHATHHRSKQPTAWASFSFHPGEAVIQAAFVPLLCLLIPIHAAVLLLFLSFMTVLGVINHLGYELYPRGFARSFFFRHWISATHHQMHHERTRGNYGLYFTFWDRLMNTHHKDYEELYRANEDSVRAETNHPVVIVGGGLWGSLLAYRLTELRPELPLLLIEAGQRVGGNHTWSFHASDVSSDDWKWLKPLVSCSWEGYQVRFPSLHREIQSRYYSIRSDDFSLAIERKLGVRLRLRTTAEVVGPNRVRLSDGSHIEAGLVIDARGSDERVAPPQGCGFQKFVGLDLRLSEPHGLKAPILMDATVPQNGDYRFFYLLPWDDRTILVEDTHYSETSDVSVEAYKEEILSYVRGKGWQVESVQRQEVGVLPIPYWNPSSETHGVSPVIGARAGIFHDTTGYSLPDAVRIASRIASLSVLTPHAVTLAVEDYRASKKVQRGFLRSLNRMLFLSSPGSERYRVLEHFYRLPETTIARFYAGELGVGDVARIFMARPPVPVRSALSSLLRKRSDAQEVAVRI